MSTELAISDARELYSLASSSCNGIFLVKPRVFFSKIEWLEKVPLEMNLFIPSSGLGSITMLEAAILVSILRIVKPNNVFEFGTFLGYTASLFIKNTKSDCLVYSLDLGDVSHDYTLAGKFSEDELHQDEIKNDDYLRYTQSIKGPYYSSNLSQEDRLRLHLLIGDSRTFFTPLTPPINKVDLIFIDGGHDIDTVRSDTFNAFQLLRGNGVIIWHDYKSNIHSEVTDYLDEVAQGYQILHVQHTLMAICFIGDCRDSFLSIGLNA